TTLINCVSGSLHADEGRILFDGRDITTLPAHRRTRLGIARSFQIPKPFTSMSVRDNLGIPMENAGHAHAGGAETEQILREIGLAAKAHLRMAGLSHAEVDDILAILFRLNAQGITIIMIEHIMRAVMRFSERIVVLDAGERIAEGTPGEIVRNPAVEKAYLGE